MSDADRPNPIARQVGRAIESVGSLLPTIRGRLFALVLLALVPALVILVYDEWLARQRGFAALTDPRFARIPIIATMANAMKADLDACLAAGMNDHVTKPIDRKALLATLRRWLPVNATRTPVTSTAHSRAFAPSLPSVPSGPAGHESALAGIDVSGTLQRLGIERASLDRMLLRFADGQRGTLEALRASVVAGDTAMAANHAHAIAGAAGNLGASGVHAAAKALEQAGREGRTDLSSLFADLEERAATVFRSIESLRPPSGRAVDPTARPFDPAGASAALERLTAALDDFDLSSASRALADLGTSGLPPWAADDLGRLQHSGDGYDYAEARGIASRLLARVHDSQS